MSWRFLQTFFGALERSEVEKKQETRPDGIPLPALFFPSSDDLQLSEHAHIDPDASIYDSEEVKKPAKTER